MSGSNSCLIAGVAVLSWVNLTYLLQFLVPLWGVPEAATYKVYLSLAYFTLQAMIVWSYYMTVRTHPGRVPVAWRERHNPPVPTTEMTGLLSSDIPVGKRRYCAICCHWKPPRTHHCSTCRQCILKYDHHCPWVANCIGFYNYKHFLLLVLYLSLASLLVAGSAAESGYDCTIKFRDGSAPSHAKDGTTLLQPASSYRPPGPFVHCPYDDFSLLNFVAMWFFVCLCSVVFSFFTLQHLWWMLNNRTYIENKEFIERDGKAYADGEE
eukprot:gene17776-27381_t